MVTVRPFKGLRPKKKMAPAFASLPYDVMDSDEARAEVKKNPQSFLHVTKSEVDLDPSIDQYDPRVYQKAGENLRRLIKDKTMVSDRTPNFYFYRQIMGKHSQVGLVATVSAEEYEAGLIKKHEFTRPDKEQDRVNHILGTKAQCGPVFLVYHDIEEMSEIQEAVCASKPENDFTSDDGIQHTVWVVKDRKLVKRIGAIFKKIPALYVADGHHRSAAGTIVKNKMKAQSKRHTGKEEHNFFLAVIFPKTHMQIMPYNRAVQDLNGRSPEGFLEAVGEKFTCKSGADPSPSGLHNYSMYMGGKWFGLKPKPGTYPANDPVRSLDASILQENLLAPILGIENLRTDKRIKFIGGIRGTKELEKLVDSGKFAVAFSLYPVKMDQIISVADSGNVMPPKSTWFEPKLRSGLIVHQI